LSQLRQIFFDKTGTLTTGEPALAEVVDAKGAHVTDELLQIAASLEHHSEHPLARAVIASAKERGIPLLFVEKFQALPGQGIKGIIAGHIVYVGNWRLIEQQALTLDPLLKKERERLEKQGLTVVYIGWAGQVQGLLAFSETLRPEAGSTLREIQQRGLTLRILTGDSATAGAALGQRLGIPVQSELLPHEKLAIIEAAENEGLLAMVGDGLNDAPALARAGVGIALGCGANVTREAADVSLLGNDLSQISWTLALAQRTYRTIAWNLAWAFVYNLGGIGLAMAGLLHPILAAAAMVLSSGLVVVNSLRIFRFS
jgi:Cu+-exporting ATPase